MLKQIKKLIMGKEEAVIDKPLIQENLDQIEVTKNEKKEIIKELDNINDDKFQDKDFLYYSAEAVGYPNREDQWNTYRVVLAYIPSESSILDFGCGRGDLYSMHTSEYGELDYYGIDSNEPMITAGKELYPDIKDKLEIVDWNEVSEDIKRDWCVNIGSLNLRYDANMTKDDFEYLQDALIVMYEQANVGVIALLTTGKENDGLIDHDPGKILNWAQKEFGNVILDHSVSKDGFCLIINK
jgi:SAM-dependent methyltransferase